MTVKQLAWWRSLPVIGNRAYDSLKSVQDQVSNLETQTNTSAQAQPQAPPAINGFRLSTGPGGEHQIEITDQNQISRGINYWAELDSDPNFSNPHIIDMGQSRNYSVYLGAQTLYGRGYSSYASSPSSPAVYHGSPKPLPVTGGVPGPRAPSQGAGTGAPKQGLQGPGPVPQRSATSGFDWTAQGPAKNKA